MRSLRSGDSQTGMFQFVCYDVCNFLFVCGDVCYFLFVCGDDCIFSVCLWRRRNFLFVCGDVCNFQFVCGDVCSSNLHFLPSLRGVEINSTATVSCRFLVRFGDARIRFQSIQLARPVHVTVSSTGNRPEERI